MGHVRVTTEYGTATVWLDFPGEPVNALDRARLADLDAALAGVAANPRTDIVVLRSARAAGFCAGLGANLGLAHPTDRAAFAAFGQRVAERVASLPQTTVAFLDGPVLGAGLELALACDHRLVLSRVTTHLGFRGPTCLGGAARVRRLVGRRAADELLTTGRTLSGREAVRLGLVDHAFCERRGKIELRTFLDTLERRGWRPRRRVEQTGLADERRVFAAAEPVVVVPAVPRPMLNPLPPLPAVVGLLTGVAEAARFAAEAALRGGRVVAPDRSAVDTAIAAALARGFVTPLEAEQARARVTADGFGRADLVFTDGELPAVGRRCVVAVVSPHAYPAQRVGFARNRRTVGVCLAPRTLLPHADTDPDAVATLAEWLTAFGRGPTVLPAPRPVAVRTRRPATIPA
ncbi:enoyl-CoA hydratase/isomerase family protein [Urbifossiella limnaea]|uniref:Fatty acid oxidation complex subunit alpha n=1 Tax=Urbifossiella limnaea TaxID=2528023 RepID=A0A517XP21_9BACT|nr:enoyl-CoA hydratase/isomerase family protein [Urbifossiella limnaea]QDU19249.1 Fatty acid oxidation complex subunit alpha [Urbifossiella limnaea]